MDWLYGVIGFVVVTVVLTLFSRSQKKRSWSGVVSSVKTITETDQDGNFPTDYLKIKIKLDSGKTIKKKYEKTWLLNKYPNGVNIGDRLVKNSGDEMFQLVVK